MPNDFVVNVVVAGVGGQGVIKAADILAEAAFRAGCDVKQSEIHGMSQRGGSVTSDVRFGACVLSPMVPEGSADFLLVLEPTQVENNLGGLRAGGETISPSALLGEETTVKQLDSGDRAPLSSRNFNVAMLGVLSRRLEIPETAWLEAIRANLPRKVWDENETVFGMGRAVQG